jgi:hypothetical protein
MPTHLPHQALALIVAAVAVGWLTCGGSAHPGTACVSCVCCPAALHCCCLLPHDHLRAADCWLRRGTLSSRLASLLVGAQCWSCSPLQHTNSPTTPFAFHQLLCQGFRGNQHELQRQVPCKTCTSQTQKQFAANCKPYNWAFVFLSLQLQPT